MGHVTPNLREVYVLIKNENSYHIFFYYDKKLSELEEELASLTDSEFIADFPSPEYNTQSIIKVISYPEKVIQNGFCVYKRYEEL